MLVTLSPQLLLIVFFPWSVMLILVCIPLSYCDLGAL